MKYTTHALNRMEERNITINMIEDSIELFYRYGGWNDRADRLTLNTASERIHSFILRKIKLKNRLKHFIRKCRISGETEISAERFIRLKNIYKLCSRQIKNLKKLEHKKRVTLVICDNKILTVYRAVKRDKKNTHKISSKTTEFL